MTENRRHFRYPEHLAERAGLLFAGAQTHKAMVIDESAGGLGVIVESVGRIDPGRTIEFVELTPRSVRRRFRIVHVTSEPRFAITRLGLEWLAT